MEINIVKDADKRSDDKKAGYSPAAGLFLRRERKTEGIFSTGRSGVELIRRIGTNLICNHEESHGVCTCGFEKVALSKWQEGLQNSKYNPKVVRHIVNLETELTRIFEDHMDTAVDEVLKEYDRKKYLKIDDVTKGITKHYQEIADNVSLPFSSYYRALYNEGREDALKSLGMIREARRRIIKKAVDEDKLQGVLDQAFTKVKTVDVDVIEQLRQEWIDRGGPADVVESILLEEEEELRGGKISPAQLRERIKQLWRDKRYILERIVRTETVNAYAKIQLQEWYDQGIREVERFEINDLSTCTLCRTLAKEGMNIFLIEELLQLEYPVTHFSHPNCRGGYRPRQNWSVFEEFETMLDQFQNASDIEIDGITVQNVPVEYQEQVEQVVRDFAPDYGIRFTPEITEDPIWKEDRLRALEEVYGDKAERMLALEQEENDGKIIQYTADDGTVLISPEAGDLNEIVLPILRQRAGQAWIASEEVDKEWILNRYNRKIAETKMTLEKDNVQIFGDNPFVTPLAGESPLDYFVECYATYVADPSRLLFMDREMYDFLRDRFMSTEYVIRGGIQ